MPRSADDGGSDDEDDRITEPEKVPLRPVSHIAPKGESELALPELPHARVPDVESLPPSAATSGGFAPSPLMPVTSQRRDLDSAWLYPHSALATTALRALMTSRGEPALFRGRTPEEHPGDRDAPYRASAFWQATPSDERIYPFLRCVYGEMETESRSPQAFRRGEPIVGVAWRHLTRAHGDIGQLFTLYNLKNVEDFHKLEPDNAWDAWRAQWTELGLPDGMIAEMSRANHGYATRVRSLACVGVKTAYGDMVICIESVRRHAFRSGLLTHSARRKYQDANQPVEDDTYPYGRPEDDDNTFEESLRSILNAHVLNHMDFWTWVRKERVVRAGVFSALASTFALLPGVFKLFGIDWLPSIGSVLTRLFERPELASALATALVWFLVGAFMLLPQSSDVSAYAGPQIGVRLHRFVSKWWSAYFMSFLSSVALCLQLYFVPQAIAPEPSLDGAVYTLITALAILSSYFIMSAYFCVHYFGRDRGPSSMEMPGHLHIVFLMLGIACSVLVFVGMSKEHTFLAGLGLGATALISGLALCMLIGRLDSRLTGTPSPVIALLYLGAIAHATCQFSFLAGLCDDPDASACTTATYLFTALRGLSLPLDVLLFTVIVWAIRGRALERYLLGMSDVAVRVPYSTWTRSARWIRPAQGRRRKR